MMATVRFIVLAFGLSACALSHRVASDSAGDAGPPSSDAAVSTTDAASPVDAARVRPDAASEGITCGPNVCRGAEICCDARCGICAFDGECPDFDCPG